MNIALLGHNLLSPGGVSIGSAIFRTLPQIAPQHRFYISYPDDKRYYNIINEIKELPNVVLKKFTSNSFFSRFSFEKDLSRFLENEKIDWCWWLGNMGFVFPKITRQSLLLHNAYYFNYPYKNYGFSPFAKKSFKVFLQKLLVKRTIYHCTTFYVQTLTLKQHFLETYPINERNVHLCPSGINFNQWETLPKQKDKRLSILLDDQDAFKLLYISAGSVHKNHLKVIEMFSKFYSDLHGINCYFTVDDQENIELVKEVNNRKLNEKIKFLGRIPFEQLPFFYMSSDANFFPSLLETVGIGLLEGMYWGLPTIASDLDFAHEACGDSACFFDPFSIKSMKNAILKVKNDQKYREELISKGKKYVKTNVRSWDDILISVLDTENISHC